MAGPCSPKHGPVHFTVLKNLFVWMLCSHAKTIKCKAGPRSPTSLVTAQLILRRRRIVWFWCCADIQQRSNERMVELPLTRFSFFQNVENTSHLDGMKLFKNIRIYNWAVLPQTRPSSVHDVEEPFRLDVLQAFKHTQVHGWAALPNIPCHGPAQFPALKNRFVLLLCKLSTTLKWTDVRAPPNTVQGTSRCWRTFPSGWYEVFQKHSNLWLGRAPPNTAQLYSRCWRNYFFGCSAAIKKHSSLWLGRVPQHPLSLPSSFRVVEEPFRFDVMQTFNNVQTNGWSCSPKHGPAQFTVLKNLLIWMVWSFSKTLELMAGPCSPKHGPVPFTVLKYFFVWMLCSHVKTFKLMAGPRSPTSPVPAQLISRRWRIVSLWCCADTQQLSNERLVVLPQTRSRSTHGVDDFFYLDGMKLFKNFRKYGWVVLPQTRPSSVHGVEEPFRLNVKHSSLWLGRASQHPLSRPSSFRGVEKSFPLMLCRLSATFKWMDVRAPPNTIQLISRCWELFSSGWYKAFQKHSNLWLGRALPNTAQFYSRCWRTFLSGCYAAM